MHVFFNINNYYFAFNFVFYIQIHDNIIRIKMLTIINVFNRNRINCLLTNYARNKNVKLFLID